jgi:hypothetical protein
MKIANLMALVAKRIGRVAKKATSPASAGPAILAGGLFFAGPASAEVLYSQNFESLVLMEPVSDGEILDFGEVWTDVPPAGWVRDNADTPMPDPEDPGIGPEEFYGFTFVDKEWWIATSEIQERDFFTLGDGIIMVADADEYDDLPKLDGRSLNENGNLDAPGAMNVFITTQPISLIGFDPASAAISFDSSFRPYDLMTGLLDVSFDNGTTWKNLLTLDLDAFDGVNSSLDRSDETLDINLGAPANATQAMIRFGLIDAGNDWWWAIDNIEVTATGTGGRSGDFNNDGSLTDADIDLLSAEVRAGTNSAQFDVNADSVVNDLDRQTWVNSLRKTYFGDANLDGEFNSADFVLVFTTGQYEDSSPGNSGWRAGDWNGDGDFTSTDFVTAFQAGAYEKGPRLAAAVPEPSGVCLVGLGAMAAGMIVLRRRT